MEGSRDSRSVSSQQHQQQRCCRNCRVRMVRSKGAILVLVWCFFIWESSTSALVLLLPSKIPPVLNDAFLISLVQGVVTPFCCPLAGLLADVYFGRYKVMMASVWLMWFGGVITVLALTIQHHLVSSVTETVVNYVLVLPAGLLILVGYGAFIVNAIPFGTDQMPEASGEEVSAFIHWLIWSWYAGSLMCIVLWKIIHSSACINFSNPFSADLITSVIVVVMSTATICSSYLYEEWLTIEPKSQNPLKTIVSVLRYAVKHKRPTMRSALTYWEEDIPPRVDLGKSKYGGPFTTEQVEDVKTFFRILIVVVSMCVFLIFASAVADSTRFLIDHFKHSTNSLSCGNTLLVLVRSGTLIIVVSIPIYELFVYPLARNWIPSMLKRVGIGAILMIALALFLLTADAVEHSRSSLPVPCMFVATTDSPTFNMDSKWVEVPYNLINAISIMLFFIPIFEFVYAQTPYGMKGFLTGITWAAVQFCGTVADCLVHTAWYNGWKKQFTNPSCGVLYYIFMALVGIVGLIIFCIVAKWYRRRQRDELASLNEHTFVEDYYERYM